MHKYHLLSDCGYIVAMLQSALIAQRAKPFDTVVFN